MIRITDPEYYYALCRKYEVQLRLTGQRVWLDSNFYEGFRAWIKEEYNIDNNGTVVLSFEDERDHTMFMLRWNRA